jgi:hypothetical protein
LPIIDLKKVDEEALQRKNLKIDFHTEPPQLLLGIDIYNELKYIQ